MASHVLAAKDLVNASIGSTKGKYKEEARKLRDKLQKMHREQIERLNADNVVRNTWINQFVDDLDSEEHKQNLDPLDELVGHIGKFKESQESLQ